MSGFNEEPYSAIFASLKHPIRRKILRMLSERTMSFSEMLETLEVSSSFLTYHLENLGELVIKTDDGKYRLSSFGKAALATMTKVEDIPSTKNLQLAYPTKLVRRTTAITLGIICILLISFSGGAIAFYASTVSDRDSTISSKNSTIASLNSEISQLNSNLTQLTSNLTSTIASKDNQISSLKTQLSNQSWIIASLNSQISQLNSNLNPLSTYGIYSTPYDVFEEPCFDVTPAWVHLGTVGQTFTVTIALHGVTEENVPDGVVGFEVHMTWDNSLVEPVNSSLYIGIPPMGALWTQTGWQAFYDDNGSNCNQQLAQATEFDVGGFGADVPWWSMNSTGIVAVIAFNVTSQPNSLSTICSLHLTYAKLYDATLESEEGVPVSGMIPVSSDYYLSVGYDNTYPDGKSEYCYANITAYPTHGDSFVLSYRLLFNGTTTDWINETMTKNGNVYSATIYCWPLPYFTVVQWKVTGYDNGYSFQTPNNDVNGYINWPD